MTRGHVNALLGGKVERQSFACEQLTVHIANVFLACGVTGMNPELLEEVQTTFSDRLRGAIGHALDFQCVTGERIVSVDLLPVFNRGGDKFQPEYMDDEWADPKHPANKGNSELILGTTQLGLVCEERHPAALNRVGGGMETSSKVLLKPKVVLMNILEDLKPQQVDSRSPHTEG